MKKCVIALAVFFIIICKVPAQNTAKNYLYKIGEQQSIYSEKLQENRDIWVQLPDGGNINPNLKYPVVYVLDGSIQMEALNTVYDNYWGNYLPRMILVGISNRTNRTRDLTTSETDNPNMETGGAEKFTEFIEKELIPYIERKYPVSSYRTLIGHSYAGLFTVNTLINHSQLFSNYIAIDPSMDWDDQKLLKEAMAKLKTEKFEGKSLFVTLASPLDREDETLGIEDVLKSNSENSLVSRSKLQLIRAAEKEAPNNHLNISWKYYPEDIHGTVALPSILEGMKWLFEWYQLKDAAAYNNPETQAKELERLLNEREKILAEHFGYAAPAADEEMLNMGGYMYMQMGQTDKAKLFFGAQVKYYPWSANAYDSMADFYISQNDKKHAIKNLQKAYELSGDDSYKEKIRNLEE